MVLNVMAASNERRDATGWTVLVPQGRARSGKVAARSQFQRASGAIGSTPGGQSLFRRRRGPCRKLYFALGRPATIASTAGLAASSACLRARAHHELGPERAVEIFRIGADDGVGMRLLDFGRAARR